MIRQARLPAALLLVVVVASCGDGGPLLFPEAATVEPGWAPDRTGVAGRAIPAPPTVRVRDARGNAVPGVEVRFRVAEGEGSVRPATVLTDRHGVARPEAWVLGEAVGRNVLLAEMGSLGERTFEAFGEPGPPDILEIRSSADQESRVATAVPAPPTVRVRDQFGNPITGVEVAFIPDGGSGTVTGSPVTSGADGEAMVGSWTLGTRAGPQRLRALAAGVAPAFFRAEATPDTPAAVERAGGNGQSGAPGQPLAQPLAARVVDEFSNPVPDQLVTFSPAAGSGSVSPGQATTDASGIATTSWTLGSGTGTQRVVARIASGASVTFTATTGQPPPPPGQFHIQLHFVDAPTTAQRQAFENAAARWATIVTGDLPSVPMNLDPGACGANSPALDQVIDDVLIFVFFEPMDGPGGTLAQAGPCWLRSLGLLPVVGLVRIDSADLPGLTAQGLLETVALHEIGHVLGIGTLWNSLGFLRNPSLPGSPGVDTHFDGPRAITAFDGVGGAGYVGGKVPVENEQGGSGTRDSHWRRSVFGNELMIGFITGASSPLSRITAASLGDLGYEVALEAADPFSLPVALRAPPLPGDAIHVGDDIYRGPLRIVDPDGRLLQVIRR